MLRFALAAAFALLLGSGAAWAACPGTATPCQTLTLPASGTLAVSPGNGGSTTFSGLVEADGKCALGASSAWSAAYCNSLPVVNKTTGSYTVQTTDTAVQLGADGSVPTAFTLPNPGANVGGRYFFFDGAGLGYSVTTAGGTALFDGNWNGAVPLATEGVPPWTLVTCTDATTVYQCANVYAAALGPVPKGLNTPSFQYKTSAQQAAQITIMQELGVQWARFGIYQTQMDGSCAGGYIYYGNSDNAVTALQNAGIKVLLYFAGTAACDAAGGVANAPPSDLTTSGYFLNYYVTQIVDHYAAMGMHNWEVWNEPDTSAGGNWSAANYATFVCNAYNVIKTQDPSSTVVGVGGSASGTTYLSSLYTAGLTSDCDDAISAHPYNPAYAQLRVYNHDAWGKMFVGTAANDITQPLMAANGDGNKQIWVTETGCSTSGTVGNFACTLTQQAQWVLDAFSRNNSFPTEGPVFWFSWADSQPQSSCTGLGVGTNNTCLGLVYGDFATIKPSGYAFQKAQ